MRKKKIPVIWAPQPKQVLALERCEFEILYGGARGGGKTDAGQAWEAFSSDETGNPVYLNPRFAGLVLRQQSKDLNDWIERAKHMYRATGAEFTGNPIKIRFPSGAYIITGHLNDIDSYGQYQGHEYQRVLIEELTQIASEISYVKILSSCRSTVPNLKAQIFCTTNPGDVGHDWVKKRWKIPDIVTEQVIVTPTEFGDRAFIHATVYDNKILNETDPNYTKQLEAIPDENLRRAWLMGEWGNPIIPGAIYKDELDKAEINGQIGLYPHNPSYPVHTYWDIGVGDATVIGFFQFIRGTWFWIDYLEDSGKGLSFYRQELDRKGYHYGNHFGPHDLSHRQMAREVNAETISEIAESLGITFTILPKEKINKGILTVKERFSLLHIDGAKCAKALYALKNYRREYDEDKKIFKDIPIHDWTSHCADMVRYWAMAPEPVTPGMDYDWSLYSKQTYT